LDVISKSPRIHFSITRATLSNPSKRRVSEIFGSAPTGLEALPPVNAYPEAATTPAITLDRAAAGTILSDLKPRIGGIFACAVSCFSR
jgi:hypothetical protein